MTDRVDISNLLSEMRALKSQSQAFGTNQGNLRPETVPPAKGPQFGELFSQAVNKVNAVQQTSGAMADAYIRGEPGIDIADVMIASQKSNVAFQAMTQVRNKVVEAYKDVMNMPI